MKVTVNGEPVELPEGTTIAELLRRRQLNPDRVAVEVNRRLVRSSAGGYDRVLRDGDAVEIVTFVGGG
ncbi:MAG: sulfur carrier protein ThiS [Tepidisphaerales bacterium]